MDQIHEMSSIRAILSPNTCSDKTFLRPEPSEYAYLHAYNCLHLIRCVRFCLLP